MDYSLQLEFFVQVPPDELLELLLNPDFIKDWSKASAMVNKEVGGKYSLFDGQVAGSILKIEADELTYTWKRTEWPMETLPSEVHYQLKEVDHGTEVLLTHSQLPNEAETNHYRESWDKDFFALIDEYLANRKHG
jgi:activator of HSP90 ATPase